MPLFLSLLGKSVSIDSQVDFRSPEFGSMIPGKTLKVSAHSRRALSFGYCIHTTPYSTIECGVLHDCNMLVLDIDGRRTEISFTAAVGSYN